MESLYLLVPVALIFVVVAIRFFFWAINSGQYDDLDTEGQRILFDDAPEKKGKKMVDPEQSEMLKTPNARSSKPDTSSSENGSS